jgi:hypothetical protein
VSESELWEAAEQEERSSELWLRQPTEAEAEALSAAGVDAGDIVSSEFAHGVLCGRLEAMHALHARATFGGIIPLPAQMPDASAAAAGEDGQDDTAVADSYALPESVWGAGVLKLHTVWLSNYLQAPVHLDRAEFGQLAQRTCEKGVVAWLRRYCGWYANAYCGRVYEVSALGLLTLMDGAAIMEFCTYLLRTRELRLSSVSQAGYALRKGVCWAASQLLEAEAPGAAEYAARAAASHESSASSLMKSASEMTPSISSSISRLVSSGFIFRKLVS